MTLSIPDDILQQAGITEHEALLELAVRLFDTDRLGLSAAGRLAGLDRVQFEIELEKRGIPAWRPTLQDLEDDIKAIREFRSRR